jgi:putative membrane protein
MEISSTLIALVALLHAFFLVLEMFLWDKPLGMRIFGHRDEQARATKLLAMNQGLYNGFLAAGLTWSLIADQDSGNHIAIFFLACVIVAGLFGGITVSKSILFVQALPAAFAMAAILF